MRERFGAQWREEVAAERARRSGVRRSVDDHWLLSGGSMDSAAAHLPPEDRREWRLDMSALPDVIAWVLR
jgi:hypothetical protein